MSKRRHAVDPDTGCAHIVTVNVHGYKFYRCCSNCDAIVPDGIEEAAINYCWDCGYRFDHTDDEHVTSEEKTNEQ